MADKTDTSPKQRSMAAFISAREFALFAFSAVLLVATPERFASFESTLAELSGQTVSKPTPVVSEAELTTNLTVPVSIDLAETLANRDTELFGAESTSESKTNYVEISPAILSTMPVANNQLTNN